MSNSPLCQHWQDMIRYMLWADGRTIQSVRDWPAASEETVPLMAHLLAAEAVWLARIEKRSAPVVVWPELTLEECESLYRSNSDGYKALAASLTDEHLTESITYTTSQGQPFQNTISEILSQVVTHGPYHRGQIAKIVGRHGGKPLMTDYILYAREKA